MNIVSYSKHTQVEWKAILLRVQTAKWIFRHTGPHRPATTPWCAQTVNGYCPESLQCSSLGSWLPTFKRATIFTRDCLYEFTILFPSRPGHFSYNFLLNTRSSDTSCFTVNSYFNNNNNVTFNKIATLYLNSFKVIHSSIVTKLRLI